jgi:hypothetical protein
VRTDLDVAQVGTSGTPSDDHPPEEGTSGRLRGHDPPERSSDTSYEVCSAAL